MIEIPLPNGKAPAVPRGTTPLEVAERIAKGLARAAHAVRVNDCVEGEYDELNVRRAPRSTMDGVYRAIRKEMTYR